MRQSGMIRWFSTSSALSGFIAHWAMKPLKGEGSEALGVERAGTQGRPYGEAAGKALAMQPLLRAQRGNPADNVQGCVDCRVAGAPRNDGGVLALAEGCCGRAG